MAACKINRLRHDEVHNADLSTSLLHILQLSPSRAGAKVFAIFAYIVFLLLCIVPFIGVYMVVSGSHLDTVAYIILALIQEYHFYYLTPAVTVLALFAWMPQAHRIITEASTGSLSLMGLAVQAVVFAMVGLSWMFRLTMPREYWDGNLGAAIRDWYLLVGWVVVYNLVFALAQAVLFRAAWYHGNARREPITS